eukprot:scaffold177097_cov27-Tisochrysis_lutea.AAC.1
MAPLAFAALLALAARTERLRGGALDSPMALITPSGDFSPEAATALASLSGTRSVVATVGGRLRARRLLNALFSTSFETKEGAGAFVAAPAKAPKLLIVHTEAGTATALPEEAEEALPVTDVCALGSFALSLADAVLVIPPCAEPTKQMLISMYESVFAQHLATTELAPEGEAERSSAAGPKVTRTLLVHVAQTATDAVAVRAAAEAAWAAAAKATSSKGIAFASRFDLVTLTLPSAAIDKEGFSAGAAELRTRLSSLAADGFGKPVDARAFASAAAAVWAQTQEAAAGRPPVEVLQERFAATQAYEAGMEKAQLALKRVSSAVAAGRVVDGFGPSAARIINETLISFDAAVADVGASSAELVARRRERLLKAVQGDVKELFNKQQRSLARSCSKRFERQLLGVQERAGTVAAYQLERLRKNAERAYDAQVESLIVPGLGGPTRQQLTQAFSAQLTTFATKFVDSPAMQLKSLGATRRRVSRPYKPPRGLRWGLALTSAVRPKWGEGTGSLSTFGGYQTPDGLWSAHCQLSNDGNIPESSGEKPPTFRMQPKLNLDLSI